MRSSGSTRARPRRWMSAALASLAAAACATAASSSDIAHPPARPAIPVNEHLTFSIRYLGIHCGVMTLDSFEAPDADEIYRVVLEARTSSFFDGIYRVRVQIEARYDATRDSSLSYHHVGQEKKDSKDELWLVDFDSDVVRRTRDGDVEVIPFSGNRVIDPLTFLYRMRILLSSTGDRATLPMMTSDGDIDTVAEVTEQRTVKTPFGKREVLIVVPHPAKNELFTKKGKMEIWVGTDDQRLPYRVVFDLPFGKLVAKLVKVEPHTETQELQSGDEL